MNLREVRKLFIEQSGRYDLWNEDGSDNGADRFIQAGQKHLETLVHWDKMDAVKNLFLNGASNFMLERVRVIKHVYARLTHFDRFVELIRVDLAQARNYALMNNENAFPLFYTPIRMRGQIDNIETENFFLNLEGYTDVLDSQNFSSVGILLTPFISKTQRVQIEVHGLFRSDILTVDTDTNYWTSEWPNVLLQAAMRELEISNRNTQGVRDWDAAITSALIQQDMDSVMDESYDVTCMLG